MPKFIIFLNIKYWSLTYILILLHLQNLFWNLGYFIVNDKLGPCVFQSVVPLAATVAPGNLLIL